MITVAGYASLLSPVSARKTAPNLQNFRYGYVKGFRRVFNKAGIVFFKDYLIPEGDIRISSCATQRDPGTDIFVSVFQCSDNEFLSLYDREHRFRWVEVECVDANNKLVRARMCSEFNDRDYFLNKCVVEQEYNRRVGQYYSGRIWRTDILPFPPYLKFCLNAAQSCGQEAYDNFLSTSFLADGETTIEDFISSNPDYLTQVAYERKDHETHFIQD